MSSSWTIYRWDWQFGGTQGLDEAYVPFFGAAWDDAGRPLECQSARHVWSETDAVL